MLVFKSLKIKNFMSFGNIIQNVNLDSSQLTLVLGDNLDVPAESGGSRNGVGKSAIINAFCFALYGESISNIKMDNLINITNEKVMEVSITFEKMGAVYRVDRGRKPNYFKFFVDNKEITQGDPRETQLDILGVVGISCELFKQIIGLNTLSLPFLSQPAKAQRDLIEELLRISELSTKAENLKENIKETKELILAEDIKIKSVKEANNKIQKSIDDLKCRNNDWNVKQSLSVSKLESEIESLLDLDIDTEIVLHQRYSSYKIFNNDLLKMANDKSTKTIQLSGLIKRKNQYIQDKETINANTCPTCNQSVHDDKNNEIRVTVQSKLDDIHIQISDVTNSLITLDKNIDKLNADIKNLGEIKKPFYETIDAAYSHRSKLESMGHRLQSLSDEQNPYDDQMIVQQENLLQVIDDEYLRQLNTLREHQEFLLKLLTNKDSIVRKTIIEQNLNYLNCRLSYYIEKLGLPHSVMFMNDLSVEVSDHGRDLDFGNLSRGEGTRLILGLSFAFRDVFESVESPINMFYIDEILDQGLDGSGIENTLRLLKSMNREQSRSIFLISHREELIPRVDQILSVVKDNGFSSILNNDLTLGTE